MSEETAPAKIPLGAKAKLLGIGTLIGLLIGGGGAGKVWLDMRADLSESTAQAEARATELTKGMEAATAREKVLRARVLVARAMSELGGENYGNANKLLAEAADQLGKTDAAAGGFDAAKVGAAAKDIGALKLAPGVDVMPQRASLKKQADALDALLGG